MDQSLIPCKIDLLKFRIYPHLVAKLNTIEVLSRRSCSVSLTLTTTKSNMKSALLQFPTCNQG